MNFDTIVKHAALLNSGVDVSNTDVLTMCNDIFNAPVPSSPKKKALYTKFIGDLFARVQWDHTPPFSIWDVVRKNNPVVLEAMLPYMGPQMDCSNALVQAVRLQNKRMIAVLTPLSNISSVAHWGMQNALVHADRSSFDLFYPYVDVHKEDSALLRWGAMRLVEFEDDKKKVAAQMGMLTDLIKLGSFEQVEHVFDDSGKLLPRDLLEKREKALGYARLAYRDFLFNKTAQDVASAPKSKRKI